MFGNLAASFKSRKSAEHFIEGENIEPSLLEGSTIYDDIQEATLVENPADVLRRLRGKVKVADGEIVAGPRTELTVLTDDEVESEIYLPRVTRYKTRTTTRKPVATIDWFKLWLSRSERPKSLKDKECLEEDELPLPPPPPPTVDECEDEPLPPTTTTEPPTTTTTMESVEDCEEETTTTPPPPPTTVEDCVEETTTGTPPTTTPIQTSEAPRTTTEEDCKDETPVPIVATEPPPEEDCDDDDAKLGNNDPVFQPPNFHNQFPNAFPVLREKAKKTKKEKVKSKDKKEKLKKVIKFLMESDLLDDL